MAQITSLELTAGTAVVATALSLFTTCLPNIVDVLDDDRSGGMRDKLNFGLPSGAVATASVGIVLSFFTHSIMPVIFAVGMSIVLWAGYEVAYGRMV